MHVRVPPDIERKIEDLFDGPEREEVSELIGALWNQRILVGPDQLARSILVLSGGKIDEVRQIFASSFWGDPRDVIVEAERRLGGPGHYLTRPLSKQ
jgi:hypothetical protein